MKKTITFNAAVIAIAIFSGTASAYTDQQSEDILYGTGTVNASPHQAYVRVDSGPKGMEGYLLDNLHETEHVSNFEPYVQNDRDRDNRDDLLSNI